MMRIVRFTGLALAGFSLSVLASDGIRVVNEGGIRDKWTLPPGTQLAVPAYPAQHATQRADVCVAIGYLINPDGGTSDYALLKTWSSAEIPMKTAETYWAAFAQASAEALAQWRFQPRPEVSSPRPVYTVATMLFGATSGDLRRRCAIPNLTKRLRQLRAARGLGRRSAILDKLDI